jgi:hypothetical protein
VIILIKIEERTKTDTGVGTTIVQGGLDVQLI